LVIQKVILKVLRIKIGLFEFLIEKFTGLLLLIIHKIVRNIEIFKNFLVWWVQCFKIIQIFIRFFRLFLIRRELLGKGLYFNLSDPLMH